jgi:hypothetical protein
MISCLILNSLSRMLVVVAQLVTSICNLSLSPNKPSPISSCEEASYWHSIRGKRDKCSRINIVLSLCVAIEVRNSDGCSQTD